MAAPVLISIFNNEPYVSVLSLIAFITTLLGTIIFFAVRSRKTIGYREGFAMVTLGWVAATVFGALPFWLTGVIPDFADAFFESMSGFTTTGASILTDVESLPKSLLFWRILTHWLGGMGIMVLFVALLSQLGAGGMQVFRAEAPGPITEKIKPRISETAKILWYTYVIMTFLQTVTLMAAGMNWFDAVTHAFSTIATGGFSTKNQSVGFFQNPVVDWIIIVFTFAAGANFSLYYSALANKSLKNFWRNEEFKVYTFLVLLSTTVIWVTLSTKHTSIDALRLSAFQVTTIITTTGFATANYDFWPPLAKGVLFLMMLLGSCTGSTTGGIKIGRYLVLIKNSILQLKKFFHPRAVFSLKISEKSYPESVIMSILQFFFLYIFTVIIGTLAMTGFGLDLTSALTSVLATLGNVGPGFGEVGPTQNFGFLSSAAKYLLSFFMLLGRLEIYTVLVLFMPSFWRK